MGENILLYTLCTILYRDPVDDAYYMQKKKCACNYMYVLYLR